MAKRLRIIPLPSGNQFSPGMSSILRELGWIISDPASACRVYSKQLRAYITPSGDWHLMIGVVRHHDGHEENPALAALEAERMARQIEPDDVQRILSEAAHTSL